MCQHCCSDTIRVDSPRELRANPLKVPPFETEAPYFSVCRECGLTYRAKAEVSTGYFASHSTSVAFKPWGTPCDYCGCKVSSQWDRVSLVATEYGVSASGTAATAAAPPTPGLLRTATISVRNVARRSSLVKSATGSLRAAARFIGSRKNSARGRGETFSTPPTLDQQHLPGAASKRRRMDRDHNIPYDWEVVEYDSDSEVYTYRDGEGGLHRTHPGNRYGPYIHLT
ncbi:hypothetical protein P171DRAFT_434661 [Karstenula rhodostoma CBS 690.94]|uniref:Probable double zinc ribbon domain-containing protein n=1 Tax=Karstenula rhodostoma CBS 690.94 TaxID=1392251 RepID=A0A9P4U9D1_9PLEO|nr:hypothetical protein P171DRAFT_434661 [Karstenula rhodostoma CBS 690.94]